MRSQSNGGLNKFSKITESAKNVCMKHIFIQQTHNECLLCASYASLCPAAPKAGPILSFSQVGCHPFYNILFFLLFMLLQLSLFFPLYLPPPVHTLLPIICPLTVVHVCRSFIYVLWLIPSPSFSQPPYIPSPLIAVSLFHNSMPLVLFCSLDYFVH